MGFFIIVPDTIRDKNDFPMLLTMTKRELDHQ